MGSQSVERKRSRTAETDGPTPPLVPVKGILPILVVGESERYSSVCQDSKLGIQIIERKVYGQKDARSQLFAVKKFNRDAINHHHRLVVSGFVVFGNGNVARIPPSVSSLNAFPKLLIEITRLPHRWGLVSFAHLGDREQL
jgi:hypothetical protein